MLRTRYPCREDWWRWENTRARKGFSNFSKINHQPVAQIKRDTWFLTEWLRGCCSFVSTAWKQCRENPTIPWVSPESASFFSKACLRTRQPCSILDLQPLKGALLLVLQSCGVSRILSESRGAHFEVCFHSSALATLQWQLDSFICRTGGWWGVARYVWTSWFVDKDERLQRLAGMLCSLASGWQSRSQDLYYNFSRLRVLSDL